jgi:hypothetical protein
MILLLSLDALNSLLTVLTYGVIHAFLEHLALTLLFKTHLDLLVYLTPLGFNLLLSGKLVVLHFHLDLFSLALLLFDLLSLLDGLLLFFDLQKAKSLFCNALLAEELIFLLENYLLILDFDSFDLLTFF